VLVLKGKQDILISISKKQLKTRRMTLKNYTVEPS